MELKRFMVVQDHISIPLFPSVNSTPKGHICTSESARCGVFNLGGIC